LQEEQASQALHALRPELKNLSIPLHLLSLRPLIAIKGGGVNWNIAGFWKLLVIGKNWKESLGSNV